MTRRAGILLGLIALAVLPGSPAPTAHAAPVAPPQARDEDDDISFGINFIPPEEPLMSVAWDAGARVARIQINWQDIERSPGNYGWDYTDSTVLPLIDKGYAVQAVLTLPPSFRRSGDGLRPGNTNLPWDHPDNHWAEWVGAVAAHYRGRIESYEIWNEPDLDQYWNGTPGEYFQLLRSAYPAVKANDPDAKVVMAGMAIFGDPDFFPEVMRNVATHPDAPDNDYFFDALSIHLYTDSDLMYEELLKVRALLDRYDLSDKPIWLTETGVPLAGVAQVPPEATLGFGSEEEAGWFILQGFSTALAAGVERIMVYRLQDSTDPVRFGMLRPDASERPSFEAYRVATRYLDADAEEVTRRMENGATIVEFVRKGGGRVAVLWANDDGGAQVSLPAQHSRATQVDWAGNTRRINAQDGAYTLTLAPTTNEQIGGPPLIIVEEDGIPPTVSMTTLPDSVLGGTHQLALSWSGDDGDFGTGVTGFDVQVSHDGGPWMSWFANTKLTQAIYDVSAGGQFLFRVRARDGAGNLSDYVLANTHGTWTPGVPLGLNLGANYTSLPPVGDGAGDPFFGANFVPPDPPWIDLAWDAGVRSARIQINWQDIERSPDTFDWHYTDSQLLPLANHGYEITAVLTLPPEFRRASPDGLTPADLYLQWNHPDNGWGNWVFEVAQRYGDQIDNYEIWNEPDLDIYWNGTAADYAELLRSAYQAIAEADPDSTVVMGGMALREDPNFLPDVIDYIYNDEQGEPQNYFFDVVAIHVYSETDLMYDEIANVRTLLNQYGMGNKRVWVTETNVPIWGEASGPAEWESGYADLEEASWFIIEALATARSAGVRRVMIYRFNDVGEPIAYGLLRADQSERPSYTAYQTAATFMADVESASREQNQYETIVRMDKANGGRVTVVWANTGVGATVTLDATAPAGLFANADGAVWQATPDDDGTYTIELDPATNRDLSRDDTFFFGGPPILLIEEDFTPPTVVVDPLPGVVSDESVTVSWSGDDGELGTGVASYDVQVQVDEGGWETWLEDTQQTEAELDTSEGGVYRLRVRARDRAGNQSEYVETEATQVNGLLVAQVLNVRGEPVPNADVVLRNLRTYQADGDGVVRITDLPEGETAINHVDGGPQGVFFPAPVTLTLGEETHVTWVLLPRDDRVPNGRFDTGLTNWQYTRTTEEDVQVLTDDEGSVLRLSGQRRAWGSPSASVSFQVPRRLDGPVLSFRYRLPTDSQALLLTVVTEGGRGEPDVLTELWQSQGATDSWEQVWFDATPFLGQQVTLIFSLRGPKGAPSGIAQIDDVSLGSVPAQ